ncbi:hypothetical protein BB561_002177 [Smittium simulii]|uniref:Sepiapterin reductase n=1 Tax=Smittium simulii TaxID=133385 RepID=A0A2T9YRH4_9FUNG|nr:hypothetical protein BB561_002177 [Smittium simulii]
MDHLVLIIGSASGFGECLTKVVPDRLFESFDKDSQQVIHLVLVSRAFTFTENTTTNQNSNILKKYLCDNIDLANMNSCSYEKLLNQCKDIQNSTKNGLSSITLIHNAGTVGNLALKVEEYESACELVEYFNVNLVSFILLNSLLVRWAKSTSAKKIHVVQISSLLAIKAFSNWGLYAAAKAARDQIFAVMAAENPNSNNDSRLKFVSYAPGPLDNSLQQFVRKTLGDLQQKKLYTEMFESGNLVSMEASANVLMDLLVSDQYISGSHIDYYD